MAKPNYNYQKKQKELARQAKQAAKRERRQGRSEDPVTEPPRDEAPTGTVPGGS